MNNENTAGVGTQYEGKQENQTEGQTEGTETEKETEGQTAGNDDGEQADVEKQDEAKAEAAGDLDQRQDEEYARTMADHEPTEPTASNDAQQAEYNRTTAANTDAGTDGQ